MSETRKLNVVPWIAGVVPVLLGLYVGAYYAMVKPHRFRSGEVVLAFSAPDPLWLWDSITTEEWAAELRLQTFFSPIHWLDRRIRPHFWEPTP